jgi:hypothetical protein
MKRKEKDGCKANSGDDSGMKVLKKKEKDKYLYV